MEDALWTVDWRAIFNPTHSVLEMMVRGTLMYFVIFVLMRVVLKRQAGGIGTADVLVIVLVAEVAGHGFAGDARSITEGTVLVATILFWTYVIERIGYHYPAFERLVRPGTLKLVEDGRILHRNMRAELITKDELMAQLRENGIESCAEVKLACMEADGMISVIKKER